MFGVFKDTVREKLDLSLKPVSGNRTMTLPQAVKQFIRPGMHLHVTHAPVRPNALIYEICRQFWNKSPDFVISALGFTSNMVLLIYGGLTRKIITTFCGDAYPFPGPNRIYQEAFARGRLQIENWTVLTLAQRLMAGAMGVEGMATHSLRGSSMEKENAGDFWITHTPEGKAIGMVRALRPDLSLIHAWAADPAGNLLLNPPYAENVYSLFAAREGVIATVEHLVDTAFLRRYSHFVKVPGYLVKGICLAPLGAHPAGISNQGLKEFDAYAEDESFLLELREVCKDQKRLDSWVKEWIEDCPDHETYIRKLGKERIWYLKGRSAGDSWWSELATGITSLPGKSEAEPMERMVVTASRVLKEKVQQRRYETILAGIGASNLAAWKAWFDLRRADIPADLMAEVGFFGYTPRPADPFIFNFRNISTCTMLTDVFTVLGSMISADSNRGIGVLGAGQVDQYGNINSTKIPEMSLFLVGSGGACDVALGAQEVIVLTPMNPFRCVEKVGYVTAPGQRVKAVVTDRGVLEKEGDDETLTLTGYFGERKDEPHVLEKIRSQCGWELKISAQLKRLDPPTAEELLDIRLFDPKGFFLIAR